MHRCNPDALRHCVASYSHRQQQLEAARNGPSNSLRLLGPRGGVLPAAAGQQAGVAASAGTKAPCSKKEVSLSYVATVDTMLHELELVESAVKAVPELWEAPSLEHFQQLLWGPLDEAAAAEDGRRGLGLNTD